MKKEIENRLYNSKRNLIVTGDILTGKTTNILFPLVDKIINKEESLLMLDSKEEYINNFTDSNGYNSAKLLSGDDGYTYICSINNIKISNTTRRVYEITFENSP